MGFIWVNGCFDILHVGHINLLEYAKSLGHVLIVGIDSDKRVGELKGKDRPYNNEQDRKKMLESIKFVDLVHIFNNEEELIKLIETNHCSIMVVGDDYKDKRVVGSESVERVEFFTKIDGYSTTNILNNEKLV